MYTHLYNVPLTGFTLRAFPASAPYVLSSGRCQRERDTDETPGYRKSSIATQQPLVGVRPRERQRGCGNYYSANLPDWALPCLSSIFLQTAVTVLLRLSAAYGTGLLPRDSPDMVNVYLSTHS